MPVGTTVNSQFVTFEPGDSQNDEHMIGDVVFSSQVLAIITSDNLLASSNYLGDSGITYEDPFGVGLEAGDFVTIDSTNPDQIDWNTSASIPGDSVRVITAATATSAVPEPCLAAITGLGAVLFAGSAMTRVKSKDCESKCLADL